MQVATAKGVPLPAIGMPGFPPINGDPSAFPKMGTGVVVPPPAMGSPPQPPPEKPEEPADIGDMKEISPALAALMGGLM
jgi:hypothetical protein